MIVYIDLVIILNYLFDFLNLSIVNITLKRNIKLKRILFSSLIGEFSLLVFIIKGKILILFLKFILAIIINIICFSYRNLKYTITNILYFYMTSIILGGFIYFLKLQNINYLLIILISPLILYIYYKQSISLKNNFQNYYQLTIYFNEEDYVIVNGYLDTGNKLKDPITNKNVILLNKKLAKCYLKNKSPIYVPYTCLNYHGLLKCFKPFKIVINNQKITNSLIGIMEDEIGINGIDCIINTNILEELK